MAEIFEYTTYERLNGYIYRETAICKGGPESDSGMPQITTGFRTSEVLRTDADWNTAVEFCDSVEAEDYLMWHESR